MATIQTVRFKLVSRVQTRPEHKTICEGWSGSLNHLPPSYGLAFKRTTIRRNKLSPCYI